MWWFILSQKHLRPVEESQRQFDWVLRWRLRTGSCFKLQYWVQRAAISSLPFLLLSLLGPNTGFGFAECICSNEAVQEIKQAMMFCCWSATLASLPKKVIPILPKKQGSSVLGFSKGTTPLVERSMHFSTSEVLSNSLHVREFRLHIIFAKRLV